MCHILLVSEATDHQLSSEEVFDIGESTLAAALVWTWNCRAVNTPAVVRGGRSRFEVGTWAVLGREEQAASSITSSTPPADFWTVLDWELHLLQVARGGARA